MRVIKVMFSVLLVFLLFTIQGCGNQAKGVLEKETLIELTEQNIKESIDLNSVDKFKNTSVILKGYLSGDIKKNPNNEQYQGQVSIGEQGVLINSPKDITEFKSYDLVEVSGKVSKIVTVKTPSGSEVKYLLVEVDNIKKTGVLPESERAIYEIIKPKVEIEAPTGIVINVNEVQLFGKKPYTCIINYQVTNQTTKILQSDELWVTARGYYQGEQVIVIRKTKLILNALDIGTYGKNLLSGNSSGKGIDKLVIEVTSNPY